MSKRRDEMLITLSKLGFTTTEARQLLRIERTLHTWSEHECNGAIQRDEETNVPYWYNTNTGKKIGRTSDRETGARERAFKIAKARGFKAYFQGDPRGCALYLYRQTDLDAFASRVYRPEQRNEASIHSCYNSVGTAVCA